jgi:hypothetical protein
MGGALVAAPCAHAQGDGVVTVCVPGKGGKFEQNVVPGDDPLVAQAPAGSVILEGEVDCPDPDAPEPGPERGENCPDCPPDGIGKQGGENGDGGSNGGDGAGGDEPKPERPAKASRPLPDTGFEGLPAVLAIAILFTLAYGFRSAARRLD